MPEGTSTGARRGRTPSLTEEQIVAAALRLSRAAPLEELSMRALARELGVPVMTIYNYVPNKDGLYELVVNHILRSVPVPPPGAGPWDERMRQLMRAARAAMAEFPAATVSRLGGRAVEATRLSDGVMSILTDGGFGPDEALVAWTTLFTFMLGQIELDGIVATIGQQPIAILESVTGATLSRDEIFERGFDVVVDGLRTKFRR
jgi:AcrR family transcriptional regulator